MNDLETMTTMLCASNIEFKQKVISTGETMGYDSHAHNNCTELRIMGGYGGFFTLMIFTPDGKLAAIEAYE
jgi:hypothetical protein